MVGQAVNFEARETPTVIIGVGGSGDWVLREIKAAFVRVKGSVPASIQFVGIDTAPPADQVDGGQPGFVGQNGDDDSQSGVPPLSPSETLRLNSNLHPLCLNVRADVQRNQWPESDEADGSQPHLRGWLQADEYLQTLANAKYVLFNGASQLRQFGRAGLFAHMLTPPEQPRTTIRQAMLRVQPYLRAEQGVEVYIVSSVGGGTGAGMLIDIAHIARQEARRLSESSVFQAYLFTQQTFDAVVLDTASRSDMAARAYATMREINRFKSDFDKEYGYPIPHFAQSMRAGSARIEAQLFDFVHYIDGYGTNNPLTQYPPTTAHYPMVAEAIRSFIDDQAGKVASARRTNVPPMRDSVSSVGAFAVVLPVQAWLDGFELRLAKEALQVIAPQGASEFVLDAADNLGLAGKLQVNSFLDAPSIRRLDGAAELATGVPARIKQVLDAYNPSGDPQLTGLLENLAGDFRSALSIDGSADVTLTEPEAPWLIDDNMNVVAKDGSSSASWRPKNQVQQCRAILKDTQSKIDIEFGAAGEDRASLGTYRATLKRCQLRHRESFQKTLAARVDSFLNPTDTALATVIASRTARLGYVQDFLRELDSRLSKFIKATEDIQNRRNDLRPNRSDREQQFVSARGALQTAELRHRRLTWPVIMLIAVLVGVAAAMAVWASGSATAVWSAITGALVALAIAVGLAQIKGEAYTAQRIFVEAANDLLREYETDALVQAMATTCSLMRHDLTTLRESVDAWALAFRAPGPESVLARVAAAESRLGKAKVAAGESKVRRQLWNQVIEDKEYRAYVGTVPGSTDSLKLAELLQSIRWRPVTWTNNEARLPSMQLDPDHQVSFGTPGMMARNIEVELRKWARGVFDGFANNTDIVKFLLEAYPGPDGLRKFARELYDGIDGAKLQTTTEDGKQAQTVQQNFVRIPDSKFTGGAGETWINDLMKQLMAISGSSLITRALSADPHSCALVYTLDNIHISREMVQYREGQAEYLAYSGQQLSRSTLHCFPAEVNASKYERKLHPLLSVTERAFDNRIVRLLEHPGRLKLFLRARCLNLIRSQVAPGSAEMEFVLYRSIAGGAPLKLTLPAPSYPDVYAAMRQFACGAQSVEANAGVKVDPIDFSNVNRLIVDEMERRVPGRGVGERVRRLEVLRDALEAYQHGEANDSDQPRLGQSSQLETDLLAPRRNMEGKLIQNEYDPRRTIGDRDRMNGDRDRTQILTDDLRDLLRIMLREEIDQLNAQIAGIADSY